MKKSRVIEIFRFLSGIKLNKITNKEVRSAVISNHLQMYNISKSYDDDVQELRKRFFEDKDDEINKVNALREKFKNESDSVIKSSIIAEIESDHKELLELEQAFYKEVNELHNSEIELNLKKIKQLDFIDACTETNTDITGSDLILLEDIFED